VEVTEDLGEGGRRFREGLNVRVGIRRELRTSVSLGHSKTCLSESGWSSLTVRAVKRHQLGNKICVSESSLSYSESCECDLVTSRGLVGGGPREWGLFEIYKHVVMLRFPESTSCTGGFIF